METSREAIASTGREPVRTFEENLARTKLPIRPWVAFFVGAPIAAGVAFGARESVVKATFWGSAMAYLTTAILDFGLHFKMEKERTGKAWGFEVVPKGETANHVVTVAALAAMLLGQIPRVGPGLFLALGWRDEIVYHRRRSDHREDMLHTVAHLAAGVMLATFTKARCADSA